MEVYLYMLGKGEFKMEYNKLKALHFSDGRLPYSFEPTNLEELFLRVGQRPNRQYTGEGFYSTCGSLRFDELYPMEIFRVNGFDAYIEGVRDYSLSALNMTLESQAELMMLCDGNPFFITVYVTPNLNRCDKDNRLLTLATKYLDINPFMELDIVLRTPTGDYTYAQEVLSVEGEGIEDLDYFDTMAEGVMRFTLPDLGDEGGKHYYATRTDFIVTFTLSFINAIGETETHFFTPNEAFVLKILDRYNTF